METMPDVSKTQRRIVVEWANGLRQIVGHTDEQPPDVISTMDGGEPVSLVKCTPRAYIYHQMRKPEGLGKFDERQK
jgi:hypothetical protein